MVEGAHKIWKRPNTLFLQSRQLAVGGRQKLQTAYRLLPTQIGEHIEKYNEPCDAIHIRVIWGARRPSLLTPNSSLLT